jgi:hypothetical protein
MGAFWFMTSCCLSLEKHSAVFCALEMARSGFSDCNHMSDYMLLELRRPQYELEMSACSVQLNTNFCHSDHLFLFILRYPPGYVLFHHDFDFFNYAGIHRPVYV